jgi:hypothetical protein
MRIKKMEPNKFIEHYSKKLVQKRKEFGVPT